MKIRVFELGPFGSRIDRGTINCLEDLPEGYETISIEKHTNTVTVIIEPARVN